MLASHTSLGNPAFRDSALSLAARFRQEGNSRPQITAYARLYESIRNQASTLSYIDAFWVLGIAAGIMFVLSFLLKKNNPRGPRSQVLAH
jgi:DHA2 family multidrug resistance protein